MSYDLERVKQLSTYSFSANNQNSSMVGFYQKLREQLYALKATLESQEAALLGHLTDINSLNELDAEIRRISGQPEVEALTNGRGKFFQILKTKLPQLDMAKPVEFLVTDATLLDKIIDTAGEISFESINAALNANGSTMFRKNNILASTTVSFKLNEQVDVFGTSDLHSIVQISTTNGEGRFAIPETTQKKLKDEFGLELIQDLELQKLQVEALREAYREAVANTAVSPELQTKILNEFDHWEGRYNFANNQAVIKGFLGEIRANAIIQYLSEKTGLQIQPTGDVKNAAIKNASFGIDTVLHDVGGIQVKNWYVKDDLFTMQSKEAGIGMGDFIQYRMRPWENSSTNIAGGSDLSAVLYELFGRIQYNQPISNDSEYLDIYSNLQRAGTSVESLCEYYIGNIINVQQELKGSLDTLQGLEEKKYFNTIWMIRDRVVPSSYIIGEIINNLTTHQSQAVSSAFNITYDLSDKPKYPDELQASQGEWIKLSNHSKMHYSVSIDLNKIMEAASARIG